MVRRGLVLLLLLAACGDNQPRLVADASPDAARPDAAIDAPPPDAPPDAPPDPLATLAGTGLCLDAACTEIDPAVREYTPRFELWADGATKRRWFQLPPGTQIDSTDMDRWVFPVGTKFWKEFTRDGVRVETRFLTKLLADDEAPGAWFFVAYQWNEAQTEAVAVPGGVTDANGTPHDIPSRGNCKECHEALRPTRVLGFGAIQLDGAAPLGLEDLIAGDLLTAPPTAGAAGARFPIPGDATEQAALAYLHANCGHCHNPSSPTFDTTPVDLRLVTTQLATVSATPTFLTTVDHDAAVPFFDQGVEYDKIIISGDAASSGLIVRMNIDNPTRRMPKLGSEVVDPAGQAALTAWIDAL